MTRKPTTARTPTTASTPSGSMAAVSASPGTEAVNTGAKARSPEGGVSRVRPVGVPLSMSLPSAESPCQPMMYVMVSRERHGREVRPAHEHGQRGVLEVDDLVHSDPGVAGDRHVGRFRIEGCGDRQPSVRASPGGED